LDKSNLEVEGERLFDEIKHCLEVQKIVDEPHNARNYDGLDGKTGFNGIRRIVET